MPTPVGPRPIAPLTTSPTRNTSSVPTSTPPAPTTSGGGDAFEPGGTPALAALPASLNLSADQLRHMVDLVSISVSTRADTTLASTLQGTLTAAAGTRLSASASGSSVYLSADPPMTFDPKPGPAFKLRSLSYDFANAKFHVDAQGVGPDFIYSAVSSWAATHYLKPLLPAAMQRPGYDPRTDPNLVSALRGIATGGGTGAQALADAFEKPTLSASFHTGDEIKLPVANGQAELSVAAGTPFEVTAEMSGPATHPQIDDVQLRALGDHGITVAKTKGLAAGLAGLEVHQATLSRGGQVKLDYELIPEQMLQGGYALLALFGAALGDPSLLNQPMPDVKLEGVRADVDKQIQSEVGPQIVELLRRNDNAIPGFSLTEALGLR